MHGSTAATDLFEEILTPVSCSWTPFLVPEEDIIQDKNVLFFISVCLWWKWVVINKRKKLQIDSLDHFSLNVIIFLDANSNSIAWAAYTQLDYSIW